MKLDNYVWDTKLGVAAKVNEIRGKFTQFEDAKIPKLPQEVNSLTQQISELEDLLTEQCEYSEHTRSQLELAADLLHHKEHEVTLLSQQVEELQWSAMANTLVISGLSELPNEQPDDTACLFQELCSEHLGIENVD